MHHSLASTADLVSARIEPVSHWYWYVPDGQPPNEHGAVFQTELEADTARLHAGGWAHTGYASREAYVAEFGEHMAAQRETWLIWRTQRDLWYNTGDALIPTSTPSDGSSPSSAPTLGA